MMRGRRPCSTPRLMVRLVPSSLTRCQCLKILSVLRNYFQFPLFLPPLGLSLELSCAPSIFSWLLVSHFLMTMQSVFVWEIPREEPCCYLRKIMKSILNERTGENPSTKLHPSLRLSFLWASNLSCLMSYQQMQLEASKTLPACC